MINEYTALMYGILIGYGICVITHRMVRFKGRQPKKYDFLVLTFIYFVLLLLSLKIEL